MEARLDPAPRVDALVVRARLELRGGLFTLSHTKYGFGGCIVDRVIDDVCPMVETLCIWYLTSNTVADILSSTPMTCHKLIQLHYAHSIAI